MLGNLARVSGDRLFGGLTRRLSDAGFRPLTALVCELVAAAASGLCLGGRARVAAAALLLVHGFCDYLDGALRRARSTGPSPCPRREAGLHATSDKVAEIAIFLGMGIGDWGPWWLVLAALSTSIGATLAGFWARRAHGAPRERSTFDRADRVVVLLLGLLIGRVEAGLAVVLVMNLVIMAQRLRWR